MRRYFGTDGIRGRVGEFPITPDFVLKLGWAIGKVFSESGNARPSRILIGKDTRISGYMFESSLEAGLVASGVDVAILGPMPTPGVAYLTRTLRAQAGIVISASHNGYQDNGIKFFSHQGYKLADDLEQAIELYLDQSLCTVPSEKLGKATRIPGAPARYIEYCKSAFPEGQNLGNMNIIVDCAHGATYHIAPQVFTELGARVTTLACEPNGLNINLASGSTSPEILAQTVKTKKADIGIAFDGDGDRVILVDEKGEVVDGDEILYILAMAYQENNRLKGGVVGTQMSNLGLEHALLAEKIPFLRSKVGDRYVMEALLNNQWNLGGESSGHIICLDKTSTGDGIMAAIQVLAQMVASGKKLSELKSGMCKYPQVMHNVKLKSIKHGVDIMASEYIQLTLKKAENKLSNTGRILLRPSGTESVLRVMVEGQDRDDIEAVAMDLRDAVSKWA